jgi:hypothetical protein
MGSVASVMWDAELAAVYDDVYASEAEPSAVEPITGVLAELADGEAALELAVGTGRIALALSARGVAVTGIELSPHMAGRLRAKPGPGEAFAPGIFLSRRRPLSSARGGVRLRGWR